MSIYKDCDIRGVYEKEFDAEDAYRIGRAIGTIMTGKRVCVSGDVRLSTPLLKARLSAGLLESGADIVDLGLTPTPAFYYALKILDVDGGVMVTASHNPPQYNGFKIALGPMPITPEDIARIKDLVEKNDFAVGSGKTASYDIVPQYLAFLGTLDRLDGLSVVVDAANGSMSEIAPLAFENLGCAVTRLFCEFDGRFPNRNPNPAVYSHLSALCEKVVETQADFGVGFDGDGDRAVFVSDKGVAVQSETSLGIFAREYLEKTPGPVVYDLKSSSVVKKSVLESGGRPVMEKSGHAFIRRTFLERNAPLAGEISGHFFFGELGHDDGLYAALRMGAIVKKRDALSALVAAMPQSVISPDLRIHCPYADQDAVMRQVEKYGEESGAEISRLDGVRLEFDDGWMLVRKSVTEEALTLRFEAENAEAFDAMKKRMGERLAVFREVLG